MSFLIAHTKLAIVTPGKWAWQSSTSGDAAASLAVDGDTNPSISSGSCSQTTASGYPIWGVDMQAIRDVHFVEAVNSRDIRKLMCASKDFVIHWHHNDTIFVIKVIHKKNSRFINQFSPHHVVPWIKHDYSYKLYQHTHPPSCKFSICKFLFSLWSLVI